MNKNKVKARIELAAHIWRQRFENIQLPLNGIVIEVAPGYEPKIGNALSLLGFTGTIFLVEPDRKAAKYIEKTYKRILPRAKIETVCKTLQAVIADQDVPLETDALVASHPFDDMVMTCIVDQKHFFSQEKKDRTRVSGFMKSIYNSLSDKQYALGTKATMVIWKRSIKNLKPNYFIASQYPSHALILKRLRQRQQSGFFVLEELKKFYKKLLIEPHPWPAFGFKGDSRWWIIAKNPCANSGRAEGLPLALTRLGPSVFIPQRARLLSPEEYDIVYEDKDYFNSLDNAALEKRVRELAIVIDGKSCPPWNIVRAYADRQKDKTSIGLSGNLGSGRAVYYRNNFNILGIGQTTLCQSTIPSHSTGSLEIVGAMRRVILSHWINYFTNRRAPIHPLLIALKRQAWYKWSNKPIPLALLVRVDSGSLDRPSHVEQNPDISIDFPKILQEYAKLDAEFFAYRLMLGAWSTSNYSLSGHIIDLESASFVKYRSPYHTSSSTYPHNRFGYEGLGFIKILRQLAGVKNIDPKNIATQFFRERCWYLGRCFLSLLGIDAGLAAGFFARHRNAVLAASDQFEILSKKIHGKQLALNLYMPLPDDDPALLDMANLFKHLAQIYTPSSHREARAFKLLIRETALSRARSDIRPPSNSAEVFIHRYAVVTRETLQGFLEETRNFIHALFSLLQALDTEECLDKNGCWTARLEAMNQDLPNMDKLNTKLKALSELYRCQNIGPRALGTAIQELAHLPAAGSVSKN